MSLPVHVDILPMHKHLGTLWPLPHAATAGAAGLDLVAALDAPATLYAGDRLLVPCGFAMALPQEYEAQVRPRSGLAAKHGLTCLNSPGTIDADYRGQVHALLAHFGAKPFVITPGLRVAQMVIQRVPQVVLRTVDRLPDTARGTGGFGSTGL